MKTNMKTLLGPLWKLYSDSNTYEILVDAWNEVYYSHKDGIKNASKVFKDEAALDQLVNKILKFTSNATFYQFEDNTRINIVLPPYAVKGPSLIIGKLPKSIVSLDDLVEWRAINAQGKKVLEEIVKSDQGFLVAGNMGSGKNTLMNILIDMYPLPQRLVTLERYPDFNIRREKVCRLKAPTQKPSEMVELVEMAERMRADFIFLSECTGPEVMPFLDLIRSHSNGAALIKGENALDALKLLETKAVISSDGLSLEDVRYAIAQSFKYIIFQERKADGTRLVSTIAALEYDSGELKLKVLFKQ